MNKPFDILLYISMFRYECVYMYIYVYVCEIYINKYVYMRLRRDI